MPSFHRTNTAAASVRANPLALSLAVSAAFAVVGAGSAFAQPSLGVSAASSKTQSPTHPDVPQTWVVQNCSDAAPNSLRDIIENPLNAKSGDIVDLSQLPMLCAVSDSRITLTTGEITIAQNDLKLVGPEPGDGSVTISGGGASRIFRHAGNGVLRLETLRLENGYVHAMGDAHGGCVYQPPTGGSLYFLNSSISGCMVASDTGGGGGGAISSSVGGVALVQTAVVGNTVRAPASMATGGGVEATDLMMNYASVSGNIAGTGQSGLGRGGGIYITHGATISASVIEGNASSYGGGAWVIGNAATFLVNSTVSNNTAESFAAALYIALTPTLNVWNSTIAFNESPQQSQFAAVNFTSGPNSAFNLYSSIIANNTSGPAHDESDLYFTPGSGTLTGAQNLVMASNVSPPGVITLTSDPMLGPLKFNGGPTKTHLPKPGSPVLGAGINTGQVNEQRGHGYPRMSGNQVDIGATQFDSIFYGGPD